MLLTAANLRGILRSAQYRSCRLLGDGTSEKSDEWGMYSAGVDTNTPIRMLKVFSAIALLAERRFRFSVAFRFNMYL